MAVSKTGLKRLSYQFLIPAFFKLIVNRRFLSKLLNIHTDTQKQVENNAYVISGLYYIYFRRYVNL